MTKTSKGDQVLLNNKYLFSFQNDNEYIFKFARRGALIKINDNSATINRLWFLNNLFYERIIDNEYETKKIFAESHDELIELINKELEVLQFGRNRKNR